MEDYFVSERKNKSVSIMVCPYCHSHDYQVDYVPFGGGVIIRALCGKCGLKSESMSDAQRLTFASELSDIVAPLRGN
jgi:hypothetical protein